MTWKNRETNQAQQSGTGEKADRWAENDRENAGRQEASGRWKKIREAFGMDKILLILLAGVLLMLSSFPSGRKTEKKEDAGQNAAEPGGGITGEITGGGAGGQETGGSAVYAAELERRLETVLLSVEGVGQVKVMITLKDHGERQLQSDARREQSGTSETDSAGGSRSIVEAREELTTVILNDGTATGPYVTREIVPEIEGVVVVAQGAGKASVKTEIYEAVQVLFNVPAHKIKVLKGVLEN